MWVCVRALAQPLYIAWELHSKLGCWLDHVLQTSLRTWSLYYKRSVGILVHQTLESTPVRLASWSIFWHTSKRPIRPGSLPHHSRSPERLHQRLDVTGGCLVPYSWVCFVIFHVHFSSSMDYVRLHCGTSCFYFSDG